ncbi:MAG: DUF1080 domain-containing protein [Verrucomicrobia bacterium]|jgi:putative membrane-bound dehydrogenase-like protein|nr:DUF1080 domain-containing protein [Verrucomicrobiota bacterium]MDA1046291.1 DUF1080 domain-containing protein [Verrucomicrobiota bacterium]
MRFCLVCTFFWLTTATFSAPVTLFDGKTFNGWEGETNKVWHIENGVIIGGSMAGNPKNEFLATTESYRNFHLRFEYKLVGTEGFVNGGVQFRSERISDPPNEMSGFQADIGAGWTGCLYDESRRRKFLAQADKEFVRHLEKTGKWNRYEVIADGNLILLFINGQRTAIYRESNPEIAKEGKIALQIHGDCKAEISFRNITIEDLPKSAVPPDGLILRRFGKAQPSAPLAPFSEGKFKVGKNEVIVFAGQENFVREQKAGNIESLLGLAYADKKPVFRPMAWEADTVYQQWRELNFGTWSEQLEAVGATMVIAQFGQMEALDGMERLPEFITAFHRLLDQFAARTKRLVLVSPMPFEKPLASHAPDMSNRNGDVVAYTNAIREIAKQRGAVFVNLSGLTGERRTENGVHLTGRGLKTVSRAIVGSLEQDVESLLSKPQLNTAVILKNRLWFDCWRPANWSFVYGDRVNQMYGKPGGQGSSLQAAFNAQLPLVKSADARIHALALGESATHLKLPKRKTSHASASKALTPEEQQATFEMAEGYEVNLFASEEHGVVNPVQIAWDERGRLYAACSPSYPQSLAGSDNSDYIQIVEDTDGDGKADKSWTFADGLTMVQGVEPGGGKGGVYVCDFDRLLHLRDTDGDGKADEHRVIFSGFGIGDTHQLINSICHGPDGTLWFSQGLHAMSRVETPWGIKRLDRAALWRFNPRTLLLEGFFGGGMAGANCWGIAFDDYGQVFHKSGDRPQGYWSVPGMVSGASSTGSSSETEASASYRASPEQYHSVGPLFETSPKTTSLDIIGTRALPDEIQGSALIGGYFGAVVELHRFEDAGSGFKTTQLPKLLKSSNNAFRPVDVSVGPDGGMYLADWYNPVIGHYQASYADPRRDMTHGRIWRITAKNRDPIKQPDLAAMSPAELLDQLQSPERWTRYQAKRLLFDAPTAAVIPAATALIEKAENDQQRLELIGIFQAHESPHPGLLKRLLNSEDARVRAYATRVTGMWAGALDDPLSLLNARVVDQHPRVRLEAVIATSYLPQSESIKVVAAALDQPRDPFLDYAIRQSARALQSYWATAFADGQLSLDSDVQREYLRRLLGEIPKPRAPGEKIYETACLACHQPGGKGLPGVYPPLAGSDWVSGKDKARLIKTVLHGLTGPISVAGQVHGDKPNSVPMPAMGGLTDKQIADVLTFIRKEFGQGSGTVSPHEVKSVREATKNRDKPWTEEELDK